MKLMKKMNMSLFNRDGPTGALVVAAALLASTGSAEVGTAPTWAGSSLASSQFVWAFSDDSRFDDFDTVTNSFGTPTFAVSGPDRAIWQDPAGGGLVRAGSGGGWDIQSASSSAPGGSFQFSVPVSLEVDGAAEFEFQVNAVYFIVSSFPTLLGAPSLSIGNTGFASSNDSLLETTSGFFGGEWRIATWTGTVSGLTGTAIDFGFFNNVENGPGHVIDRVEVYAIPEPGTIGLILGLAAGLLLFFRGRRRS
jgi:hypothetical protein